MVLTPSGVWEDVCPLDEREISSEHLQVLTVESAIDLDVVLGRGYYSLTRSQVTELVNLEVLASEALNATSWLGIPTWKPDKQKHGEVIRLFGSPAKLKYLWPSGLRLAFDVHPDQLEHLHNPDIDVLFTEGVKKADALLSAARREGKEVLTIAVNGCYGWRSKINGFAIASPDYQDIVWDGRRVYVISDSDYRSNDQVAKGWNECVQYTAAKTGPHRTFLVVTPPDGEAKVGADDYLARNRTLDSLLGQAQTLRHAGTEVDTEPTPLKLKTGGQLMRDAGTKIPYLFSPLVPEQSIMLMAGHSGTFKTWAMLSLALDGAFGFGWQDHPRLKPDAGPFTTLYVNKEMSGIILGQRLRLLAAAKRYTDIPGWEEIIDERIIFADEAALDLNVQTQRDRLEDAILSTDARLVVLDSLSMSWHGDENSASEVGAFYAQLRGITERCQCAWGLIHHLLKPTSGHLKKGDPLTASIRGSGQLTQQADVAVLMAHYQTDSERLGESEKLIVMTHAKARTDVEMNAWISRFSTNDGLFASFLHLCSLVDAKARAYSKSPDNESKLGEWILEEARRMPFMLHSSTGIRTKQLLALLQHAWTIDDKIPSPMTMRRQIDKMVEAGLILCVEKSKKTGDLYRLPDPELMGGQPTDDGQPGTSEDPSDQLLSEGEDAGD